MVGGVVAAEELVGVLDGVGDGLVCGLVSVGAQGTEAAVDVAVHIVERHVARGGVVGGRAHRVLTSPLVVRVELTGALLVPHGAEVLAHELVVGGAVVGELLGTEGVGGEPDVPAPHDDAAAVLDDDHGVAVDGRDVLDAELDVLAVASLDERYAVDEVGAGLP